MVARHIQTARRSGAKAGYRAYVTSPNPNPAIFEAGNAKAQFAWYCAQFGSQFGNAPVNAGARTPHDESEVESLIERIARKIIGEREVGVQVVEDEPTPARKPRRRNRTTSTTANGEKYAPSRENAPLNCTSGRLWRLNEAGLLTIRDRSGKPITNAQAHAILNEIL